MLAAALRKHPNEARLLDSQSRTEARRRHHERALRIASAIRQAREHLEQDGRIWQCHSCSRSFTMLIPMRT